MQPSCQECAGVLPWYHYHRLSSTRRSIRHLLRLRSSRALGCPRLESILELPRDMLQSPHSPSPRGLSSFGLLTPFVCAQRQISSRYSISQYRILAPKIWRASQAELCGTYIFGFWQLDSHMTSRYAFECEENDGLWKPEVRSVLRSTVRP